MKTMLAVIEGWLWPKPRNKRGGTRNTRRIITLAVLSGQMGR